MFLRRRPQSYFKTLDVSMIFTSSAQVFNERGQGPIVRGNPAKGHWNDASVFHKPQFRFASTTKPSVRQAIKTSPGAPTTKSRKPC
jgi:hypothetical protein